MKNIIIIIALLLSGFTGYAQDWKFTIQPMHFTCTGSNKYNDTADVVLIRVTGNRSGKNMELFCQLSNSRTGVEVRAGRFYYVPLSLLGLLIVSDKDIQAINQVLAAFDITAIAEIQ